MHSAGVKCLFSDSDDEENSPEYLIPVKDPYLSDDDKKAQHYQDRKKMIFTERNNASNFTAAELLFFWDLNFLEMQEETNIEESSTVDILKHIFKFMSDHEISKEGGVISQNISLENVKFRSKTVDDIYKQCLEEHEMLAWLEKYDAISFKQMTKTEIFEAQLNLVGPIQQRHHLKCEKENWMALMGILLEQHNRQFDQPEIVKGIFGHIQAICNLFPIKTNDENKYVYKYLIPEDVASDDSCIFSHRSTDILAQPDCVFTAKDPGSLCFDRPVGRIVVQVYSPMDSCDAQAVKNTTKLDSQKWAKNSNTAIKDQVENGVKSTKPLYNKCGHCVNSPTRRQENCFHKPLRVMNAIKEHWYSTQTEKYLSNRIPKDCLDSHCLNSIAGQHVLQLIGLEEELMVNLVKQKAIGLFMKNEYIYFSNLLISKYKLLEFGRGPIDETRGNLQGMVKYSNFKLDITNHRHRLALLIFLVTFIGVGPAETQD